MERVVSTATSADLNASSPKVSCYFHHDCPGPGNRTCSLSLNGFSHFHLETTGGSAVHLSEAGPTAPARCRQRGTSVSPYARGCVD